MQFRQPPLSGKYKNVVLGFFDILGFKDFVFRYSQESPEFLLQIFKLG